LIVAWVAASEKDPEPVVVEVGEPLAGSLVLLDEQIGGFGSVVGCAGGVVGEDVLTPATQRLGKTTELGSGILVVAPLEGGASRGVVGFGVVEGPHRVVGPSA
jgi:hypothetical protein